VTARTVMLRGRQAAEALMVDACVITRAGSTTTDDLTGAVSSTDAQVYAGKCKVQQLTGIGRRYDAGEVSLIIRKFDVHVPIDGTTGIQRGDLVTITAAAHDPELLGTVYRVHEAFAKSFDTARRLGVEEIT
jgi:Family of unknown function (DUF6093)